MHTNPAILVFLPDSIYPITSGAHTATHTFLMRLFHANPNAHILLVVLSRSKPYLPKEVPSPCKLVWIKNPTNCFWFKLLNRFSDLFAITPLLQNPFLQLLVRYELHKIIHKFQPDTIVVSYTYWLQLLSKKFRARAHVLTHDVLFDRYSSISCRLLFKLSLRLLRLQECRLLNMCKEVICVSSRDSNIFKRYISRPFVSTFTPIEITTSSKTGISNDGDFIFGFLGANNNQNVEALLYFLELFSFQDLSSANLSLLICGSIANFIDPDRLAKFPGEIGLTSYVNDIDEFYSRVRFVISPILSGSGIKIKVLEAMARGKIVLASPEAMKGLNLIDDQSYIPLMPHDSGHVIIERINSFSDADRYAMSNAAISAVRDLIDSSDCLLHKQT